MQIFFERMPCPRNSDRKGIVSGKSACGDTVDGSMTKGEFHESPMTRRSFLAGVAGTAGALAVGRALAARPAEGRLRNGGEGRPRADPKAPEVIRNMPSR